MGSIKLKPKAIKVVCNDNGYGVITRSNVQTKGVRHFTEGGYEISVFPVDMF